MDIETYILERVDNQIEWYDKKSNKAQRHYKNIQYLEMAISLAIPLLAPFSVDCQVLACLIGVLGALIAALNSISKMNHLYENWIEYRTTCERLKREKYLFTMNVSPYSNTQKSKQLFVSTIESIILSENNEWKESLQVEDAYKVPVCQSETGS